MAHSHGLLPSPDYCCLNEFQISPISTFTIVLNTTDKLLLHLHVKYTRYTKFNLNVLLKLVFLKNKD